jgi:hypothetical protein
MKKIPYLGLYASLDPLVFLGSQEITTFSIGERMEGRRRRLAP